jgi:plasmid stabilization system protein ParE
VGEFVELKLIWSEAALSDLYEICTYIAERDRQAANRVGRGILEHVRILAKFPFIGPPYPRGSRGPLREIVFRSYRIFYDVSERAGSVEILHVWHGSREDPPL